MKLFHTHIATLILTAIGAWAANAAELTTTMPVEGKANGEKWWRGNFERINAENPNPMREKRAAVNELISKYQGGAVHYMDIGAKFLEPDGTISKEVMKDFLHLGPKGFDIWAEAIQEKVKELTGGAESGQKAPAPKQ